VKSNLKRILLGCVVLMTCSTSMMAQDNGETSLGAMNITLPRAIEIALAENPTIKLADKDVQLKKVADQEAWQSLLPTLDGSYSISNSIKVAAIKTPNGEFKMGMDGSVTGIAGATLAMPVFAPAIYQNMKLTKTDILLAQEKARNSRLDLINQVTKAYYQALLAKESVAVMEKSYKTSSENFDVVKAKYEVGKVSEYDKISAEVQMRSMNSSLVSAKTGLNLALLQLKVLMGVTANVDMNIDDSLESYESSLTLPSLDANESELQNNSTLRQLDLNTQLLERTRKLLYTNFMPTVSAQLTGQYNSYSNNHWNVFKYKYSPSLSFAVSLSVPLFHASNFTKLKSNKIQLSEMADTRLNTQRNLSMAVESYKQNMASTITQVESNAEAVKQATKAVNISAKRYEVGRGTILELNQSETALTQAELTYVQSIYDYLKNKADLDYTLGRETYIK